MITMIQSDPTSLTQLGRMNTLPVASQVMLRAACLIYVWTARHRSRAALWRLSDDRLRDIGMTRAQARIEARKWFWMD